MKLASLENWDNQPCSSTPEGAAEIFAAENLDGALQRTAVAALALFKAGEAAAAKKLVSSVPRTEFSSSLEYLQWAQFAALFLKSPGNARGMEVKRRAAAYEKFVAAELVCKRANKRLRYYWRRPERENPIYRVILSRARGLISDTLGNFSENVLERILDLSRPGSGMAIGTRDRSRTSIPFKLWDTDLTVSDSARPYGRMLVESSPSWLGLVADIDLVRRTMRVPYVKTESNRVEFVPKDATTFRTIAVEPHLNMCLQLGVHSYFQSRLNSVGVRLDDQSRNQRLAFKGSYRWQDEDPLVTLDLSSASDTLCQGLVERLLPSVWCDFLDCLRSKSYTYQRADPVEYHKWSSMGNGYTFALESLIFWAISKAVVSFTSSPDVVAVYGDDIIVHRGCAALLIEVLKYCGFTVNRDKSAVFGPFRESCGKDYWAGDLVTPVYIRERNKLRPTDIYRILNTFPKVLKAAGLSGYLLASHAGKPVVRGLENSDPSSCLWTPLELLRKLRMVIQHKRTKDGPDFQAWIQRVAVFRPYDQKIPSRVGLSASLLGQQKTTMPWGVKSTLRGRGTWCLVRQTAG